MKAAILGFGTVGAGAYRVLADASFPIEIKRVLDVRIPKGYETLVTTNIDDILRDPEIEIVAEAIGGSHPAYEYVCAALRAGKHVVSANKLLVCQYYKELHTLAKACGRALRFTPAVGGGIPWLSNLRRTAQCDTILSLRGIMNGTTNYILDAMTARAISFEEALAEAQRLGYAESDPSADIDGADVRRKCAISASVAFGAVLGEEDVPTLGIRSITDKDIARIRAMGYVCKLIGAAKREEGTITAYVEPTLLPEREIEATVKRNFNCITLVGRHVGALSFIGQGAGADPTGQALAADMMDIARGSGDFAIALGTGAIDLEKPLHSYYIRTHAHLHGASIRRALGDGVYITEPLSLRVIHMLVSHILKEDPRAFVAGIEESSGASHEDR